MKKLLIALFVLLSAPLLHAQNFGKLIDQFKDEKGVTVVNVSPDQMPKEVTGLFKESTVNSIVVMNAEECSDKVIKKLDKTIRNIKLKDGYATLVKTSEDDEYVHIINKVENGKISELVVLNIDGDEVNVVWLKGENLSMDNLGNLSL